MLGERGRGGRGARVVPGGPPGLREAFGMHARGSRVSRLGLGIVLGALLAGSLATPAGAKTKLIKPVWLKGYAAPGTPKSLDKVGIIKIGSSKAKNVLVLEPGTSAAAPYFVPLAKWL